MGEKIKTLTSINISGVPVDIELNASSSGRPENEIHVQSNSFRFEFEQKEFVEIALVILDARKNLIKLKRINTDE